MANFDVNTAAAVTTPTGTEEAYIVGKKKVSLANLKAFVNAGQATTAQLATEQARIGVLETAMPGKAATSYVDASDNARVKIDGSTPITAPQSGVAATAAAHFVIKSQHDAADTALSNRIAPLEGRDLEIGSTIRTGTFNGVLGSIEPFSLAASNAVCIPPAIGTLTDGVEFGVILHGTPGSGFTCTVDFQTVTQTLQGRTGANANVVITDEVTPFTVRWSAVHAQWFIVR
jgi:hypothetical protein